MINFIILGNLEYSDSLESATTSDISVVLPLLLSSYLDGISLDIEEDLFFSLYALKLNKQGTTKAQIELKIASASIIILPQYFVEELDDKTNPGIPKTTVVKRVNLNSLLRK